MIPWTPRALFGARYGRVPRKMCKRATRWLDRAARVSALVWPDISLYEWAELAELFRAGRMALEQISWPPLVAMRRLMAGETTRALKAGHTVRTVKREHHHTCPCRQCGGRNLPPGWIPGPVRYR